jgi:hypothetical protein
MQIGIWFDYIPRWLGPTAVFLGVELILGGTLTTVFPVLRAEVFPSWFRFLIIGSFVLGALFAVIGVLRLYGHLWLYIAVLIALGSALQAASQVKFFVRVYILLTEGRWTGNLQAKLPKVLASLFVILAAITIAIRILLIGPFIYDWATELLITWTVMMFLSASIGAAWQLRYLNRYYRLPLFVGMILLFAGSGITNLTLHQDIVTQFLTGIGGMLGFCVAAYMVARESHANSRRRRV